MAVRVQLCDLPEWMPATTAKSIAQSVQPDGGDLNDWKLTERAYEAAAANPWIRRVVRVEKRITDDPRIGVLEIHAEYRKPFARVSLKDGRSYAYVSDDACRLPDEVPQFVAWIPGFDGHVGRKVYFLNEQEVPPSLSAVGVHYVIIKGVAGQMPPVGRRWEGEDIVEGLRLVALVWSRPYANQVAEVDVRNVGWRASGREPQLRLVARKANGPETIVLFGRFPDPEGDWVVPPERKLHNLDLYVRNNHGTLAGLVSRIDIQGDNLTFVPY